jgi:hypothetical protein
MSDGFCTYRGDREEALVAYLYNDIEPAERLAFETHLAVCDVCAAELAGLGIVRARLELWAPPEPVHALTPQGFPPAAAAQPIAPGRATWYEVPVWMQTAAAVLFLGVAAGAANLHITYNQDGLSVRTGWLNPPQAAVAAPEQSVVPVNIAAPSVSQADLAALEETLRREIAAAAENHAAVRQVHTLVADSERKQENELALRIASLYRDLQVQREADLGRIQGSLNTLYNNTGLDLRRQNESIRSLQVRVAQKQ